MARHRFGQFEFDAATGGLTRNGSPVRLQPQPATVLAMLVARAGEVITRDELRRALWPDGTHVDFDRSLNFAVAQVRGALGDESGSPRFIETLPKRGYRFIAPTFPVAVSEAASVGTSPSPASHASPQRWTARGIVFAIVTLVAVAVVAAIAAMSGDDRVRVAVFPFDNETADSAYQHIAGGIADETVSRLSTPDRLARLDVIGNAAILRKPREFRDVRAAGRDLGARFVVLAQLKRDEKGVRVIAHLIRVSDSAHVWAQTFDRADFGLATQTEIAEAIAAAVTAHVEA